MTRSWTRSVAVTFALAVSMVLALAASAVGQGVQSVDVAGGTTQLTLKSSTANTLADNGIGISSVAPARDVNPTSFLFNITGGSVVPTTGVGAISHNGGLAIQSAGSPNTLVLRNFIANTRNLSLSGRVGSTRQRLTFGRISLANAAVIRRGPGRIGTYIVRAQLFLTPAGARAINSFFGRNLPIANLNLGRIDLRINPAEVLLDGGTTVLTPTNELIPSLQRLGVNLGTIPPAAADTAGRLNFPITEGEWVIVGGLLGDIEHDGGVSFSGANNTPQVNMTSLEINSDVDTGPRVLASVNGGTPPVPVINVNADRARVGVSNGFLVINNLTGSLSTAATAALRAAFGGAVPEGLEVGTFRVKADVV